MDNRYEVTNEEKLKENTKIYTLTDRETNEDYSCILEIHPRNQTKVSSDGTVNIFDIGEALFQYDLDLLPFLPLDMISFDMYKEYEDYYPGKGKCLYDLPDQFEKAYIEEEKRVKKNRSKIKQLIK